ncbi:MAG: 2-iminobutanoate/2-iminopropanoate deaminase [Planctomycetes bacterium]|nr:2-iminobutanoate/2-iminopropanoate deaminase [Planctomycetota bacterium]
MSKNIQIVRTDNAPKAIGPYSQAVSAGGFLFCSGQIPLDASSGQIVGETAGEQTVKVMANLLAVLQAAGLDFSNVVKTTIFLKDMNDFAGVNDAYAAAMGGHRPARATVEVARLPKDVMVEIDCIAALE